MRRVTVAQAGLAAALALGGGCVSMEQPKAVRTAIYVDEGARNTGAYRWLELATCSEQLDAYPVDAAMIRADVLDETDVLVMPGGSSTLQARTLGPDGCGKIRDFVRRGGGYVGTCAGCFLAMESSPTHPGMLHLMPYKSDAPLGLADLTVRFNSRAEAVAGIPCGTRELRFADGPVMVPSLPVKDAEFEILATYDSDVNPCGEPPRASFAGKAAVVAGTYGKGRVFASAVHPEYSWGGHAVLRGAFKFVTGRDVGWRLPQRRRGQLAVGFVTLKSFGVETARWLQEQFRKNEFDLRPVNAESVGQYAQDHLDAAVAPGGTDLPLGGVPVFTDVRTAAAELRKLAARQSEAAGWTAVAKAASPVRVAAYADKGGADYYIAARLVRSPGFAVTVVSAADIAAGALKDFDLLVQPGGGCRSQCKALGEKGCDEVVRFVKGGGKFYGVCAGAFMASQLINPEYLRLGFVPYKDENEPVYRGGCPARMRVTEAGRAVFRNPAETRTVFYNGGPVFVPGDPLDDTDVKVLMTYDCENISTKHPDPVMSMRGKGAFLGGRVGKGKVFISGPHPEGDFYADDLVDDGIAYLTGVRPDPVRCVRRHGALVVRFRYTQSRDAVDFYLNRLLPDNSFDVRTGGNGFSLQHADVCIVPRPDKEGELGEDFRAFAENGGRVLVLADDEKKRKAVADIGWATAFESYDAILAELVAMADGVR